MTNGRTGILAKSMSMAQRGDKPIGFKKVQLLKDETLGVGAYGKVYKAKCDGLLCAAKLMHETLFDPTAHQQIAPQREHRLPVRRFEQECEFLSTIRHPNIVQYLGIYQAPDSGLLALLMELMDDNLTHFLENSPQPIPCHIQVNICHDIMLALSFLHSNGIIHRDLSGNNVLLIGTLRAKVTDFGMARLVDKATRLTSCPGADVYMPPEAVEDTPAYTEKIDCFSFGVITIQILSRQFPVPSNRKKRVSVSLPGLPSNTAAQVAVPEIERRQNHISTIDPNHILLQVALDCLKDRDVERPSAQQLCESLAALKEHPQYGESWRAVKAKSTAEQQVEEYEELIQKYQERLRENDKINSFKDERISYLSQQIEHLKWENIVIEEKERNLRQTVNKIDELEREKNQAIEEKEKVLTQKIGEINLLEREKHQAIEEKGRLERELGRINQQLEESEQINAQFQKRIIELEQLRPLTLSRSKSQNNKSTIKLTWREGKKAPCKMSYFHKAAVDDNTLYVREKNQMYACTISTSSWSRLPDCPTNSCPSVVINNLVTLVGGMRNCNGTLTNQLFSLTEEGSSRRWTEKFPPMPTKRDLSTALCTGTTLIVIGGLKEDHYALRAVEVLNIENCEWSTAVDLPQPLYNAPAAICGEHIFILGESNMHTCSVLALIQPHKNIITNLRNMVMGVQVWKEVAAPPVAWTTYVSIHGRLLAIGGWDSDKKPTRAIHMYNPTTDIWKVISNMGIPRYNCIAAVLPGNQLMVVGGLTDEVAETDSVEFATID